MPRQKFPVMTGSLWNTPRHHHHHYHHHVVPPARISLTLSHHFSLSFIASGSSSGLYPVSSQSCCMYVRADRPAFARPYVGVHRSTSLMSSSLLLQQCHACLLRLTWIVRQHLHTRRTLSETGRQVHLSRKQCLINRKGHRHAANKGMDSYR